MVVLLLALTGCGMENSPKKTVDNMLRCFARGDIQNAMQYCEVNSSAYRRMEKLSGESAYSVIISSDALMESDREKWLHLLTENKDFQNYIDYFDEQILKSYRIIETRETGDGIWEVEAELEMIDLAEYEGNSDDILEIIDTEYREHIEKYEEIYQQEGDMAAVIAVLDSVSQPICQIMKDQLKNNAAYQKETATFTVKKSGDKFVIQDYVDN